MFQLVVLLPTKKISFVTSTAKVFLFLFSIHSDGALPYYDFPNN